MRSNLHLGIKIKFSKIENDCSMIKELNINQEWLTRPTGDPFADVGGFVWQLLERRFSNSDPTQILEEVAKIYIREWDNKLHPIFANSTITHKTYTSDKKKSLNATMELLKKIIQEDKSVVASYDGFCRITGRKDVLFNADRTNSVLNGSGSLLNFHHGLEGGALVCKEVIIRNFVMPLGVVQVGSMPAIVISNYEQVTRLIAEENCKLHLNKIGQTASSGIQKAVAGNPTNALFEFASLCIDRLSVDNEVGVTMNLFHFSNFVNGPALQLYTLPAIIFQFYAYCLDRFRKEWLDFVKAHYRIIEKKKSKNDDHTELAPEVFSNHLLNALLNSSKISPFILNWVKRQHRLDFKIIENYQTKVRNMDKRTLEAIRRVAIFTVADRSDDAIKKTLRRLDGARSPREVRRTLLGLVEENYDTDNFEPLIRLDDIEFLFPEGYHWTEIRDILLIAVYEQLHESNRKVEVERTEETPEEANIESSQE